MHLKYDFLSNQFCDNVFASKQYLKSHIDNVHGGKTYDCNICSKHCPSTDSLKKHTVFVHTGKRHTKCDSCGKSFSKAGNLKAHIHTVHERHKDYKCESCGKSFTLAKDLERHIHTIHEGYKDYKCKSCGIFWSRKFKETHQKKHENFWFSPE